MCWADECKGCGKQTWAGCGKHIDSALKGIAEEARCDWQPAGRRAPIMMHERRAYTRRAVAADSDSYWRAGGVSARETV